MNDTTLRRPGRPRKTEAVQEQPAPVVEQAVEAQQPQQPQQVQYTIAKLTPHMLAGEIHRLHQEGEDLTPVHQVSDQLRGKAEQSAQEAQPDPELKAAVEAAKTSLDRPRTFVVAYRNPRGSVKVAHGAHCSNGSVFVESGHGYISGTESSMEELHECAKNKCGDAYHIGYTDEP